MMAKKSIGEALFEGEPNYARLARRIINEKNVSKLMRWRESVEYLRSLPLGAFEIGQKLDECEYRSCDAEVNARRKACIVTLLCHCCPVGENYSLVVAQMMKVTLKRRPCAS